LIRPCQRLFIPARIAADDARSAGAMQLARAVGCAIPAPPFQRHRDGRVDAGNLAMASLRRTTA
jgi:hypothetical protein